ncbi:glycerophosphodiester phosphodiesterase family protein [Salininema proteolyticum]|uniref:Glycerophosphodiester phosphodiesterase family protein n=1 Tax=Salininema proteolyticum TaxID=1607685 RepID=A0ABV8TXW7_9ACTN
MLNPFAKARKLALGAAALTAAITTALTTAAPAAAAPAEDDGDPTLIGHRVGSGHAPEMTEAAFLNLLPHDPDSLEVDVQLSADGVPFLMHDTTLKRTTDVEEVFPDRADDLATSFTWDELQKLDAGAYFSDRYAGQRIMAFEDIPDYVSGQDVTVVIELKSPAYSPGLERAVSDAIEADARWKQLREDELLTFISFDKESLRRQVDLQPDVPAMWLKTRVPSDEELAEVREWTDAFGTNYRYLDDATLDRLRALDFEVNVWTANDPEAVAEIADRGIEYITTDFVDVAQDAIDGRDPFPANPGVEVTAIEGEGDLAADGEHVVLTNTGDRPVNVSGYLVRSSPHHVLNVGKGYVLRPGQELKVYSGEGKNTRQAYYNGRDTAMINNSGNSMALWTSTGVLIDIASD